MREKNWTPIRGCSKVSLGCRFCWAEVAARAQPEVFGGVIAEERWNGRTELVEARIEEPLKWKYPTLVHVCTMGDLFHEATPLSWIARVFEVIEATPHHTYAILTKRLLQAKTFFKRHSRPGWPLANVWIGASVEDAQGARDRLYDLPQIPAALRYVAYEPALEHIDFPRYPKPDWLIVGGEYGYRCRPFEIQWAREAIAYARSAKVPVYVRRLGGRVYHHPEGKMKRIHLEDHKGSELSEWPEDLRVQEWPTIADSWRYKP